MIFVSVRVDPACITANLLQVAPSSEPPDNSHPPELGHKLRKTAARAGSSIALRDLKDIQQQLRGNALDAIVADFSVHVARDHRCVRPSPSNSSAGRPGGGIPLVTKPSRHDAIMPSIRGATVSRWEEEKAERSRRSLARLTKALLRIFPSAVLSGALGRPFVPRTPRLAIDSYWGAHLLRADRLARALAGRSEAPSA